MAKKVDVYVPGNIVKHAARALCIFERFIGTQSIMQNRNRIAKEVRNNAKEIYSVLSKGVPCLTIKNILL